MPFGQTYDNTLATNVDEKKEKAELNQQLGAIKAEIEEHKAKKEELLGAFAAIPDKQIELTELQVLIDAAKAELTNLEAKVKEEDDKHTTALMAVLDKVATQHELDVSIVEKQKKLDGLAQKIIEVEQKSKEVDEKSHILALNLADFDVKKQSLEGEIKGLENYKTAQTEKLGSLTTTIQEKNTEHKTILGSIEKQNSKLADLENKIVAKKEEHRSILTVAKEKAAQILEEAKKEIEKLHLGVNEREGDISRRESWCKEKEEYLLNLKTELEKHLHKTIKMNFGDK